MNIHFGEITPQNWRVFNRLKVKKDQEKFVASNVVILARAFAYKECDSQVHAIFCDDIPVGMLMEYGYEKEGKMVCVLSQLMIGEEYQRKGYGKKAMEIWISMKKQQGKYHCISLCYIENSHAAKNLYLNLGFEHTGEVDEDEIIMEYSLIQ